MGINKLVFAALVTGCLVAAGVGGFLAVRVGQPSTAAAEAPALPAAPASTPGVVTETEGVITPAPTPTPSPAPPVAAAPAAPRATEPARSRPNREIPRPSAPAADSRRAEAAPAPRPAVPEPPALEPAAPPVAHNTGSMWETRPAVNADPPPAMPDTPVEPAAPEYVDLEIPADAVLGLQVERTISSETARVEDKVNARVTRDVRVGTRIAIPAGSTVAGSVTEVERGGKVKGKARLAVRFHTVTLADGTSVPIRTDAVIREGQSPAGESAAKVGGAAIGGAILGAILGGGRGAAIGAGVGAAGGTAAAMANERNAATLAAGTSLTVRVQQPVTVTVQKE